MLFPGTLLRTFIPDALSIPESIHLPDAGLDSANLQKETPEKLRITFRLDNRMDEKGCFA
jgi:hypothetical protein